MSAIRIGFAAAAALALASCKDGTGTGVGDLDVTVSGAVAPRAVLLRVVGPHEGISVPDGSGAQIQLSEQQGDTVLALVIAPAGTTLGAVVARVRVANVGAVAQYTATVLQASAPDYSLISPSALAVTVQR